MIPEPQFTPESSLRAYLVGQVLNAILPECRNGHDRLDLMEHASDYANVASCIVEAALDRLKRDSKR